MNRLQEYIYRNDKVIVIFSMFLMTVFAVFTTNFSKPMYGDEFYYLMKAYEMKFGNWEVFKSDAFGLPVILYVLIKLLNIQTFFSGIILSRIVTIFFSIVSVIPLWLLSKRLVPKPYNLIPVIFYSFSSVLILHSGSGLTEPVFIFFTLLSLIFVHEKSTLRHFLLASFFAALSYYIRFNGSFLFATIILYQIYLIIKGKSKWYYSFLMIGIYVYTLLPDFYLRYITHGTIFDYGENSKYFIDNYSKVWFRDTESPSLIQYLSDNSIYEIFRKFILNGFLTVIEYIYDSLNILIFMFFLIGSYLLVKTKSINKYFPLIIFLLINIAGLSMVFDVYYAYRHIYILLPIIFIISAIPFEFWLEKNKYLTYIFFLSLVLIVVVNIFQSSKHISTANFSEIKEKEWAVWSTENLSGNVFIYGASDNIRTVFFQKDITTVKHQVETAKRLNFWLRKPSYSENVSELYSSLTSFSPRYLILLKNDYDYYPMLKEIHQEKWKNKFQLIKLFPEDELEVEVFKIN